MGRPIKVGISWYGYTRYLGVHPPTREDVKGLGSLQLTCGETYSPYSPFGRYTRQFKLDEPCVGTDRVKLTLTNNKIKEWKNHLGYVSDHLANKICEASTWDYPGVRHEHEVIPKNATVVRFPSLTDPIRGIFRNMETFLVDVIDFTHTGK